LCARSVTTETAILALVKAHDAAAFDGDLGGLEAELVDTLEAYVREWGVLVSSVRLVLARNE
jgi:hypothetical protein